GSGNHHVVPMEEVRYQPETSREEQARERAGDGDVEFLPGVVGLAADSCEAAEDEKRDGFHRDFVSQRHEAVAELVENDRGEEQDAGDDAERVVLRLAPAW